MITTLYLTAAETTLFDALDPALKEGWTVEEETGDSYEDMEVLYVRATMARFDGHPEMQEFVSCFMENRPDDATLPEELPDDV